MRGCCLVVLWACLDWDLVGLIKEGGLPPPLSSDLPGDDCASPSVVDGACGQDAVSTSFLPRPPPSSHTSLLLLVFSACAAFCTPPPKTRSHVLLVYISPQCAPTCWECRPPPRPPRLTPSPSRCTCGQGDGDAWMCACCECGRALASPGERGVMSSAASRTITASQRRPSALHPPQLCDKHQSRAAACAERRGCCYYYEGWGSRRTGGCGEGSAASVLR